MKSLQINNQVSEQILPLKYRIYSPIHHVFNDCKNINFFGKHPFVIAKNSLNRLMFKYIFLNKGIITVQTKDGFLIKVPLNDQAAASIIFEQQYSPEEGDVILRLLGCYSSFLDVGANLGYFSLLALHKLKLNNDSHIIAVEPNKKLCLLINESMEANSFYNGKVIPAAAGENSGEGFFSLQTELSSNAKIIYNNQEDNTNKELVDIVRVDDLIDVENKGIIKWVIKIDVEGSEIEVLKGSDQAFANGSIFLIEVSKSLKNDLNSILNKYDYIILDRYGKNINVEELRSEKNNIILVPSIAATSVGEILKSNKNQ
ncbi:MAG: FkbM family methyltransferase [Crinalium sp.]